MTTIEKPRPVARPEEQPDAYDLSKIQERHPDWPKLELTFYFSAHNAAADMEGVAPYLADADVLLYEEAPRSYETQRILNDFANDPKKTVNWGDIRGTELEPLVKGLWRSGKAVGSMDIGKDKSEAAMARRIDSLLKMAPPRNMNYEDALSVWHGKFAEIASLQNKREDLMVDNFEGEIEKILKSRPDLQQKEELKILATMGSYHTRLGHNFAKSGMKTDRHFPTSSYLYGHQNELQRTIAFGKQPSHELVERAMSSHIVSDYFMMVMRDGDFSFEEKTAYLRMVVSALTTEDMEDLYESYSENDLDLGLVDGLLKSRDLYRIPRDRDEMLYIMDQLSHRKKKALATTAMRG